jgi:flagellar assembly protein FliH
MATVIKFNEQNPSLIRRLETVSVSDHLGEAKLVAQTSRERARELLRTAQVDADAIRNDASGRGYEAGFRRGYEAGAKAGRAAAFEEAQKDFTDRQAQLVRAMNVLVSDFENRKRDLFISANNDCLRFAMKVAERVTRQVGVVHRDSAVENLKAALRIVESRTDLVIHMNPADHDNLQRFAESLMTGVEKAQSLTLVADESIAPGGCRLTSPDADVDATLDTQIEQIADLVVGPREVTA